MTAAELSPHLRRAIELCDDLTAGDLAANHVRTWSWGPALLGYALTELGDHLRAVQTPQVPSDSPSPQGDPEPGWRYQRWLEAYCERYAARRPRIDQSDTAAPGLVTYAMHKRTGDPGCAELTAEVVNYIRHEPRLIGHAVNHLGPSLIGRFYPRSVWVDSLMMFAVFPARYGAETGDAELVDIAAAQPAAYAELMQQHGGPGDGLWYHSWFASTGKPFPGREIFWGRGNGWVIAALPMILDQIGDHPERQGIIEVLASTSRALLPLQCPDGSFATLLARGGYRELSATALIASGWLQAVSGGYLDESYREPAERALATVTAAVTSHRGRLVLPEVSGPTIPTLVAPELGYRLVPRFRNLSFGVAAYVFAAINHDRLLRG